jgi:glycosyltransferase involved in cell wall biosynthesis
MRLAFVIPRYGKEILGGAEGITRSLVEHLPRPEFSADVLTTCASHLITWRNVYPPGLTRINGVPVVRFPVDHHFRDGQRYQELLGKFTNNCPATVEEEYEWIDHSAHSPALYHYIAQRGREYDFLIFGPYLFGITFYGTTLWPERSILWPHLHDEPFARFLQTRLMMEACRGIMFNCKPEMALARDKLGIENPGSCIVGEGMDDYRADPSRFRRQFGLSDPFVLFSGRLSSRKNLLELISFFSEYKRLRGGPLKLVLMGRGPLSIPPHPDILSIGFQNEQDKRDVFAAATVLCQPSLWESFSIVIMESWLAGVPVIVHGGCEVTRYHALRSNGGLYYENLDEFVGVLDWLMEHPVERRQMGQLGRAYVLSEYNWKTVLDRFRKALHVWQRL